MIHHSPADDGAAWHVLFAQVPFSVLLALPVGMDEEQCYSRYVIPYNTSCPSVHSIDAPCVK